MAATISSTVTAPPWLSSADRQEESGRLPSAIEIIVTNSSTMMTPSKSQSPPQGSGVGRRDTFGVDDPVEPSRGNSSPGAVAGNHSSNIENCTGTMVGSRAAREQKAFGNRIVVEGGSTRHDHGDNACCRGRTFRTASRSRLRTADLLCEKEGLARTDAGIVQARDRRRRPLRVKPDRRVYVAIAGVDVDSGVVEEEIELHSGGALPVKLKGDCLHVPGDLNIHCVDDYPRGSGRTRRRSS